MTGERPPKDFWEKLDVVSKLVSSVLLAVIAIVVQQGASRIATSLQTGDLVRNLIQDLTTRSERARQDIALIALNHSVGDQNPELVVEIAERIYRELTLDSGQNKISPEGVKKGIIALEIIKQRDPKRADAIQKDLWSDPNTIAELQQLRPKGGGPDAEVTEQAQGEVSAKTQLLAKAFPNLIYIHFRDEKNKQLAEGLRNRLNEAGFYAPGVERVDKDYPNNVRFFHGEDRELAQRVATTAEQFLSEQKSPRKLELQDLSSKGFKVQKGHVEVWINLARP
jgi:hypothetical protein